MWLEKVGGKSRIFWKADCSGRNRRHQCSAPCHSESSMLSFRCLHVQAAKVWSVSREEWAPCQAAGARKASLLQAASPMKSEAVMRQFSVKSVKVIAYSMARKSNVWPFVSPPYPSHRSLILIGDKGNSTHFVTLLLITHLPVFLSVHSLVLVILLTPKGCQLYSIPLPKTSFTLILILFKKNWFFLIIF